MGVPEKSVAITELIPQRPPMVMIGLKALMLKINPIPR